MEDYSDFEDMGNEKRRKLAMSNEIEIGSGLSVDEENCYNDNENTTERDNCGEESGQFQIQKEEGTRSEGYDNAKDGEEETEQAIVSKAMEDNIQQIQEKMEQFTQRVSGLLETGKNFFIEMSNEFEERIVMIHQQQIDKWQEEIQLLRTIDSVNEDMSARLNDAQYLLHAIRMD